jgi:hypothetical protein
MELLWAAITIITTTAALPSPNAPAGNEVEAVAFEPAQVVPNEAANCQPGVKYCFGQIVQDLSTSCCSSLPLHKPPCFIHPARAAQLVCYRPSNDT